MDVYSLKALTDQKIADDRQEAARYWLAVRTGKAAQEAAQAARWSLVGLFRSLASIFGFSSSMPRTTVPGRTA